MPGTLFVVATPIGNLEDVTARALRILRESSLIAAEDTRRTAQLLARYAIATPTTSLHEHNEARKTRALVDRLTRGETVALVSDAGTPAVSDPGQRLIQAAIAAGIRVEAIPGPSAVLAALVGSGLPTEAFTFLGFPPTKGAERRRWFQELKAAGRTVVFFEAPHRVRTTLEQLQAVVGDVQVSVGRELTKAHEESVRGQISEVLTRLAQPRGEFTIVVDVGHTTDNVPAVAPSPTAMRSEFGEMTSTGGLSRREAIRRLASRYGMSARAIYAAIESAKASVV